MSKRKLRESSAAEDSPAAKREKKDFKNDVEMALEAKAGTELAIVQPVVSTILAKRQVIQGCLPAWLLDIAGLSLPLGAIVLSYCTFLVQDWIEDPALRSLIDQNWAYLDNLALQEWRAQTPQPSIPPTAPSPLSILLCFYGDGDTRPYKHFMKTIICDDGKPLSHWIEYEECSEDEFMDYECDEEDDKSTKPIFNGRCKRKEMPCITHNIKLSERHWRIHKDCPHLWRMDTDGTILIRVQIGGHSYVLAETRYRANYRYMVRFLTSDDWKKPQTGSCVRLKNTEQYPTYAEWDAFRCHHAIIIGYGLDNLTPVQGAFNHKEGDNGDANGDWRDFRGCELSVSSYPDVLMCMGLKENPHDSLFDALSVEDRGCVLM